MFAGATGSVTLRRAAVTGHDQRGISISAGRVTIVQSRISGNSGGGLDIRDGTVGFEIRNNFIYANGTDGGTGSTTIGGVRIEPSVGGKLEYNTVVYNEGSGAIHKPGISCAGTSNSAAGNIVVGNSEGFAGATDASQVNGDCNFGNTFKAGTASLAFENMTVDDYHLTAASPATVLDAVADCAAVLVDVDGEPRPYNVMCDLGADEFTP
jgi:hypothetical protein